jgi:hypothetical protein
MKIICLHNPCTIWKITPGKIYELYNHYYNNKFIIDDKGEEFLLVNGLGLYSEYFIPINQWRESQLNKIGL